MNDRDGGARGAGCSCSCCCCCRGCARSRLCFLRQHVYFRVQRRKLAPQGLCTRQLVAAGFLCLDAEGYGGLTITDTGQALLRDDASFQYRQDMMRPTPSSQKTRGAGPAAELSELSDTETALFGRLKELRLRLAKERGVPAYVIFPDRTLADMARRRPQNTIQFAAVNGVGAAKLKKFAAPFLKAISEATVDG